MDSTSVLAALVKSGADVLAVTFTSPDFPEADEAEWVRLTASKLDVPLVELPVTASSLLPEAGIVTRRSTPLFNIFDHMWNTMSHKAAEKGRRMLITGFSGDHLFGGWVRSAADMLLEFRPIRTARYLSHSQPRYPNLLRTLRSEILSPLARQAAPAIWARRQAPVPWLHDDYHDLWQERQIETVGPGLLPGRAERLSRLTDGLISQLSEDMKTQTQPHGVELSHPLLDRRLVEFALSLPSWMLNDGATDKLVLRHAMREILPNEVTELENIPPGPIARQAIRARADTILALTRDMRTADLGFVSEPVLAEHVAAFVRGEHDDMGFWNTLTLEDWLRRWW
jgi:asparagine synthase (glutamine-hydrolysing)